MRLTEKMAERLAAVLVENGSDAETLAKFPSAVMLEMGGLDYCIMAKRTHLSVHSPCGGLITDVPADGLDSIDGAIADVIESVCGDMAEGIESRLEDRRNPAFDAAFDALRDHVEIAYPDSDVKAEQSEDGSVIRFAGKRFGKGKNPAGAIVLGRTLGSVPRSELGSAIDFKPMPSAAKLDPSDLVSACIDFADGVLYDCRKVENAVARFHRRGGRLENAPDPGRYVQMDAQAHMSH